MAQKRTELKEALANVRRTAAANFALPRRAADRIAAKRVEILQAVGKALGAEETGKRRERHNRIDPRIRDNTGKPGQEKGQKGDLKGEEEGQAEKNANVLMHIVITKKKLVHCY